MAKTSRFRHAYRDNASKGHILCGEAIRNIFPLNKVYQEYPYDKILKAGYTKYNTPRDVWNSAMMQEASRLHADWVVLDIGLIIEFQGEHHYGPVGYDSDYDKAESNYMRRHYLDKKKRAIANEASFIYIEIPYFENMKDIEGLIRNKYEDELHRRE